MLQHAQEEARLLEHSFIGTEHILLGLLGERDGLAARALGSLGISLDAARSQVQDAIGPSGRARDGSPPFTPRAKRALELSLREALQLGHNYIGTEHLLLGLVRESEGVAATVLSALGADLARVRATVLEMLPTGTESHHAHGTSIGPAGPVQGFRFSWPIYPTRVLAGPTGLDAAMRVVGVLLYDAGVELKWELPGPAGGSVDQIPEVTVTDDLGTLYRAILAERAPRPHNHWAGRTFFMPAVPDGAGTLHLAWGDGSADLAL